MVEPSSTQNGAAKRSDTAAGPRDGAAEESTGAISSFSTTHVPPSTSPASASSNTPTPGPATTPAPAVASSSIASLKDGAREPSNTNHNNANNSSSSSNNNNNKGVAMAPSVQFDEQNLRSSPALQRERLSSSNGTDATSASLAASPPVVSISLDAAALDYHRSPTSSISKRTSHVPRRDQGSSSARSSRAPRQSGSHIHTMSPRQPGSRQSRASEAGSLSKHSIGKKRNRSVVTVPSWARDESPSPPLSPTLSQSTQTASKSANDRSTPSPIPAPRIDDRSVSPQPSHGPVDAATTEATSTWPLASGAPTISEEPGETAINSPERWWTFTLPQKYRSRLHEHHLKMAFLHQRLRDDAQSAEASKREQQRSEPGSGMQSRPKKRRTDSSQEDSLGSDAEPDVGDEHDRRGRFFDEGLAGYSANGAAAQLGGSGLLDWRHGGKRPPYDGERNSSQSAERTLTNKPGSGGDSPDANAVRESGDGWGQSEKGATKVDRGADAKKRYSTHRDPEKQGQLDRDEADLDPKEYPTMSFRARVENPDVYTVHQPATPGWASPWKPEERGGGHSIEIDGYRFRPNGTGYFPRTETGRSRGSGHRKRRLKWLEWWKNFLIHNPFVPLLFRFLNVAFTTATLAVAIKLYDVLRYEDATDAVGSSPVVAIIFAPLTLVHIAFQIYLEYFGRPIGLWTVQSKLSYTVLELVFICFWSAELSLAFDNYFTSTLVCVTFNSPYEGTRSNQDPMPLQDMSKKPYLCRLQGALIGLVFVSLLAYLIVLTVSLFRIFVRVSGGRR